MPFFDFHIHPTLKSMFTTGEAKLNPWKTIDTKNIHWFVRWCTDFELILGSQSNPTQLLDAGCNLVCVAIFVPELGMTASDRLMTQARTTRLGVYLDPIKLKEMNSGALKPYPDLVLEDLNTLLKPDAFRTNRKVKVIKKSDDYCAEDKDTLHVVFTIEGCHSISSTLEKEHISKKDVLNNLDALINEYPIIAINLTHLEQYPFCNHAYGILFVNSDDFKPSGNKISEDGVAIIRHCYKKNILIDIKHMSMGARRMLIEEIRQESSVVALDWPLICTHAGFAGISYAEVPYYCEHRTVKGKSSSYLVWTKPTGYGHYPRTAFNPSSINLYDEEIIAILQSGGLIGLSLDKRILGYSSADNRSRAINELPFEEEYISVKEEGYFLNRRNQGKKMNESYCITTEEVLEGRVTGSNADYYHLCHFMSHILHLFKVAGAYSYSIDKAMKQVCIGSDFDGLINPLRCCTTVDSFSAFKKEFIEMFPYFVRDSITQVGLPNGFNVSAFADKLFFENGRDFVMSRLIVTK